MIEYAIWGKPTPDSEETLLVTELDGKKITRRSDAVWVVMHIQKEYGATDVRIQELDLSTPPDFSDPNLINI